MQKHTLQSLLKTKLVKTTGFVLLGCAVLCLIAVIAAGVYLQHNKKQLIKQAKEAFAKNMRGNLQIGDIQILLWRNFPNITLSATNVLITDSLNRPFLKAAEISCTVGLFGLTATPPDIQKLKISGGTLHLLIDSLGFDNSYLLSFKQKNNVAAKPAPSSKSTIIHRVEVKNFEFISEEVLNHKKFDIAINKLAARIEQNESLLDITAREDCLIRGLGFNLQKGIYLENTAIKANWQAVFNTVAKKLDVKETAVQIGKTNFSISANFVFGDPGMFTLHAAANAILYRDARAVLTKKIQGSLGFIDVVSPIKVDALLTGQLKHGGDPAVHVSCYAVNTTLQTPQATFDNCSFTGIYNNQVNRSQTPGDPNSLVYFNHFTGKWAGLDMVGDSIRIDNLETPVFSFVFHSQCGFPQLNTALGFHNVKFEAGSARLRLQYKGPLTVSQSIFSTISGGLHVADGSITWLPHNLRFTNCNGDMLFVNDNILINKITCNYKTNRFEITGSGTSINSALMAAGHGAVECNIFCPSFNAADFKTVFAKNTDTAQDKPLNNPRAFAGIDDILQKGDIALNITARELRLDNFMGQNAKVSLLLQQNNWQMQRASLDFDGGSIFIKAGLNYTGSSFLTNARLVIKHTDVQKVFYAFNNFGQTGIGYNNLRGTLDADGTLQLQIDNTGGITPGSIQGKVNFSIVNGALVNFKPLMDIQQYALKNRDFTNVAFAEIKNSLTIQKNQVLIPRMEISSTAMRIFAEGIYGIDTAATDISIQVPLSNLSSKPYMALDNKGADAKGGPSIYLRAKSRADGKVKLGLDLFRKFRKNKTLE